MLFRIGSAQFCIRSCSSKSAVELWPRELKQTARKLVSPVTPQIVCESRWHSLFSRQSTQQQEQCAGSPRVKTLYPMHTVQQVWDLRHQYIGSAFKLLNIPGKEGSICIQYNDFRNNSENQSEQLCSWAAAQSLLTSKGSDRHYLHDLEHEVGRTTFMLLERRGLREMTRQTTMLACVSQKICSWCWLILRTN